MPRIVRAHIKGEPDKLLGEDIVDPAERTEYIKFIRAKVPENEIKQIRLVTKSGRPLGKQKFINKIEKVLVRILRRKRPGLVAK